MAVADTSLQALELAWAGDPVSAFGGVLCFTGEIDLPAAEWLKDKFIEVLIAPYIAPEALKIFSKKKNLRILLCQPKKKMFGEKVLRSVSGGILVQDEDEGLDTEFQNVTIAKVPGNSSAWFTLV